MLRNEASQKRFFTSLRFIQNDRRFLQNLIKLCNGFLLYNLILSC